jgi:hypothetical protein
MSITDIERRIKKSVSVCCEIQILIGKDMFELKN